MGKYSKFGDIPDRISIVVPQWVSKSIYKLKHPRQSVSDYAGEILIQVMEQRLEDSKVIEKITGTTDNNNYNYNSIRLMTVDEWDKLLQKMYRDIDLRKSNGVLGELFDMGVPSGLSRMVKKFKAAQKQNDEIANEIRDNERFKENERFIAKNKEFIPPQSDLPKKRVIVVPESNREHYNSIAQKMGYDKAEDIGYVFESSNKKKDSEAPAPTPTRIPSPPPSPSQNE